MDLLSDSTRLRYAFLILQLAFHDFLGDTEVCGDFTVGHAVVLHRTNPVDRGEKLRGESPARCLPNGFVQVIDGRTFRRWIGDRIADCAAQREQLARGGIARTNPA